MILPSLIGHELGVVAEPNIPDDYYELLGVKRDSSGPAVRARRPPWHRIMQCHTNLSLRACQVSGQSLCGCRPFVRAGSCTLLC